MRAVVDGLFQGLRKESREICRLGARDHNRQEKWFELHPDKIPEGCEIKGCRGALWLLSYGSKCHGLESGGEFYPTYSTRRGQCRMFGFRMSAVAWKGEEVRWKAYLHGLRLYWGWQSGNWPVGCGRPFTCDAVCVVDVSIC